MRMQDTQGDKFINTISTIASLMHKQDRTSINRQPLDVQIHQNIFYNFFIYHQGIIFLKYVSAL